jgi:hypothetical protein
MIDIPHFMTKVDESTPPKIVFAMLIAAQRDKLGSLEKQALLEDEKALWESERTLLLQKLYGTSSEKKSTKKAAKGEPLQQVFDEAVVNDDDISDAFIEENAALTNAVTDTTQARRADDTTSTDRPKRGRKPLPPHLPREDVIHDLPDSEKVCACGCQLSKIGQETVIYSLIETAKANGLNPEEYISYVLKNIPVIAPDMIHTLLPWNVELPTAIELPAGKVQ